MVNTYFCNTLAAVAQKYIKISTALKAFRINEAFIFTQQISMEV